MIKAYRGSGLTQRAFAQKERINYTTFTAWLQAEKAGRVKATGFAKVSAPPGPSGGVLEAQLPGGIWVRGSAVELARLLGLLRC